MRSAQPAAIAQASQVTSHEPCHDASVKSGRWGSNEPASAFSSPYSSSHGRRCRHGGPCATACQGPPPGTGRGSLDLSLLDRPSLADADARVGKVAPTAAQTSEVDALGAVVRWNRYGTPSSLIQHGGFLATGSSGAPTTVARNFVLAHRALFRLSSADVAALEVVNDAKLTGTNAHAVLLRQRFGTLRAGEDGLIAVGTVGDKVAYVSSSASGGGPAPAAATLSVTQAWQKAAANVGRNVASGDLGAVTSDHG